jgi:SulP family sulfate permease
MIQRGFFLANYLHQIEVVPFFHKMAYTILARLGDDDPKAVLATVITSYALSSVLTGAIFLLLGALRLGDLVSFFPRSILLGCIGGVGVFLVLTGIEVSAGLDSSMEWGLGSIERLLYPTTLVLWALPLALSVSLMGVRKYAKHPVVMPAFFLAIIAIFYIVFAALPRVSLRDLQDHGWVFRAPDAGVPFYNFYTYYGECTPIFDRNEYLVLTNQTLKRSTGTPWPRPSRPCSPSPSSA